MPAEIRPAATVLVLRDSETTPEVFMVRRDERAAFMGGAHVFPGGGVDKSDRETAAPSWCDGIEHAHRQLADLDPAEALAWHVAAARELFEEAGVLLARDSSGKLVRLDSPPVHTRIQEVRREIHSSQRTLFDFITEENLRLALDELTLCAHWVTPPLDTRRFDTRFFVVRLPLDQHPSHDEHETTESRWTTASGALAAAAHREISLPPPTWIMLRELEPFESVDEVLAWARQHKVGRREPDFVEEDGKRMLIMPSAFEKRFIWSGDRWLPEQIA